VLRYAPKRTPPESFPIAEWELARRLESATAEEIAEDPEYFTVESAATDSEAIPTIRFVFANEVSAFQPRSASPLQRLNTDQPSQIGRYFVPGGHHSSNTEFVTHLDHGRIGHDQPAEFRRSFALQLLNTGS
jgi:hypothetical protein